MNRVSDSYGPDFIKVGDFYPGDLEFFQIWGFLSRRLRIFENLGIFIPGDCEFFQIWGFLSRGLRIFENLGIFIPGIFAKSRGFWRNLRDLYFGDWGFFGDADFFRGMGYPTKMPPLS